MSDRATIDIDCDHQTVSVALDALSSFTIGRQVETTRASLITSLLMPHIRELMKASTDDLKAGVLALSPRERA